MPRSSYLSTGFIERSERFKSLPTRVKLYYKADNIGVSAPSVQRLQVVGGHNENIPLLAYIGEEDNLFCVT